MNGKIKLNEMFKRCKTNIGTSIILPYFLLFSLELSDENEDDTMQYRNLVNLKKEYRHLIKPKLEIFDKKYRLLGTINMPSSNHYNALIFKNCNSKNNLEINKSYLYDGIYNADNNIIIPFSDNDIDKIYDLNTKIIIYGSFG